MRYPPISSYKNREKDGERLCRNCEKPVPKGFRHYCSHRCREEFFISHDWKTIRKDVLRKHNYICSICKKRKRKSQLDVDHIIPVRMGIDVFDKKNLRVLCKECHKAKTRLDDEAIRGSSEANKSL